MSEETLNEYEVAHGKSLCEAYMQALAPDRPKAEKAYRDWMYCAMPKALATIEGMRDRIEAALGALGEHPESEVDMAQRISDVRDEGRGHFHSYTNLLARVAELEAIVGKVAESYTGGSKSDRPDYVAMVTCDVVYRAYRAMNRTPEAARQSATAGEGENNHE